MKINRHNLTIVTHCAPDNLQGHITNGLQFTESGTTATNGCYSVAVTALQTDPKEPLGCITPSEVGDILGVIGAGDWNVPLADTSYIEGKRPRVDLIPRKPAKFEIYLNAEFLLKLAQSARDFATPGEDPIVRIQFTGADEPARMEARNTVTGQTWEALVMPRRPDTEAKRFAGASAADIEAQRQSWGKSCATHGERQAIPVPPPPPVEEDPFEAALRLAASL